MAGRRTVCRAFPCAETAVAGACVEAVRSLSIGAVSEWRRATATGGGDADGAMRPDGVDASGVTSDAASLDSAALVFAPPVLCTTPARGSSVAVDPSDVLPDTLVELPVELDVVGSAIDDDSVEDDSLDVDDDGLDGELVDSELVDEVESVDKFDCGEVDDFDADDEDEDESVDDESLDDESVDDEPESVVGSANATPGVLATATPTPNAIANAPIRPM